MIIKADEFLRVFKCKWNEKIKNGQNDISGLYKDNKKWTDFMNGKSNAWSFIRDVMSFFEKEGSYHQEWYALDGMLVNKEMMFGRDGYPSGLCCLLEHENGSDIEVEFWKLLFWRSPLKVLIFYDWNEYEKTECSVKKREWLKEKLNTLRIMMDKARNFFPENSETEYLLMWANREDENSLPCWRYALLNTWDPQAPGDLGVPL